MGALLRKTLKFQVDQIKIVRVLLQAELKNIVLKKKKKHLKV